MRRKAVAWERAAEVDAAARGWRRVGAIDEATHERIREAYPDPCVTPTTVWRVLTGGMVAAIVLCAFAACTIALRHSANLVEVLLLFFGGACLVATDVLEASPRSARRGAAGPRMLGVASSWRRGLVAVEPEAPRRRRTEPSSWRRVMCGPGLARGSRSSPAHGLALFRLSGRVRPARCSGCLPARW